MIFLRSVSAFLCLIILSLLFHAPSLAQQATVDDNHIYVETALLTGRAVASNEPDPNTIFPDLTGLFLRTTSLSLEVGYKMRFMKVGLANIWGTNRSSKAIYQDKLTNYWNLSSVFALDGSANIRNIILGIDAKAGPGILQYSKREYDKSANSQTNSYPSFFLGATGSVGIKLGNTALTLNPTTNMVYSKELLVYSYGGGLGFNVYF